MGYPAWFQPLQSSFFQVTQIQETKLGVVTTSQRLSDLRGKFVITDTKCPDLQEFLQEIKNICRETGKKTGGLIVPLCIQFKLTRLPQFVGARLMLLHVLTVKKPMSLSERDQVAERCEILISIPQNLNTQDMYCGCLKINDALCNLQSRCIQTSEH